MSQENIEIAARSSSQPWNGRDLREFSEAELGDIDLSISRPMSPTRTPYCPTVSVSSGATTAWYGRRSGGPSRSKSIDAS